MNPLIESIADKIAEKYNLDKDALLNRNKRIFYLDMGKGLLQVDKNTHISRCISTEDEVVAVFNALQTLMYCLSY